MEKEDKIILVVVSIILFILLCTPIKYTYKDGGTVAYKAVLWSYIDWCEEKEGGREKKPDTEFKVFPFNFGEE